MCQRASLFLAPFPPGFGFRVRSELALANLHARIALAEGDSRNHTPAALQLSIAMKLP